MSVRGLWRLGWLFAIWGTFSTAYADDLGQYPLDALDRVLPQGAALPCAPDALVVRRGDTARYNRPARVHPAFAARLLAFEQVVDAVATEVYGRAPRRIQHLGTYNCRRIRLYPDYVSEHALGNAIDVSGFSFGPLPRGQQLPSGLPPSLRRGFEVRVEAHWSARRGVGLVHQRFLHTLTRKLIERTDIFRGVFGPGWPGHKNHLHLDCAPYRMIELELPGS